MNELIPTPGSSGGEFLFYQTEDGRTRLQVRVQQETVWLTQAQMAELFQTTIPNVSMHIRNVFAEGELQAGSVVKEFLTTAADGKNYTTKFFNLDVIISVGYRVKSQQGTQFRIWATQRLREYIVKGFTMDDERLKTRGVEIISRSCWRASGTSGHRKRSFGGDELEIHSRIAASCSDSSPPITPCPKPPPVFPVWWLEFRTAVA